jgi:MFS family permease
LSFRRLTSIVVLLFGVALLEELSSGVPSSGAPDIERSLQLSHTATATVLFVVPGVVQLVLDPVVFLLADRWGRARLVRGGLGAMAVALFAAALAPGPVTLAGALSIWGVATGAAISFTEATLIDTWPEQRARTMARWTLLGVLGDVAAPLLLGALALIDLGGDGWRIGFAVVGGLLAVWTVAISLRGFPAPAAAADDDEPSLWQAAREALRDRVLVGWLFGMALCNLLDELFVVFASIHVRDELGASPAWQSLTISAFVAGCAIGLVILDRLLVRHSETRLMIASGVACGALFVVWLAVPAVWLSALVVLAVGATTAPLYPLATAAAYARRPGRSGIIVVASHLFAPFALALPWLIGTVADHAGTPVALALLVAQPIGLVVLAVVTSRPVTTADRDSRDNRTGDAR